MTEWFKNLYPSWWDVIDWAEIFTEMPASNQSLSATFAS